MSLDKAREKMLNREFDEAVRSYALIVKRDSTNALLNAEYAYALALDGLGQAALSRLDRVWDARGNETEVCYFTAQVFNLLGCLPLADEFNKGKGEDNAPEWLRPVASEFRKEYAGSSHADKPDDKDAIRLFGNANRLAAHNSYLQSLVVFDELIRTYPYDYLPYIGYSISLEKSGLFELSAQAVEKAMVLLPDSLNNSETIDMLNQRYLVLKEHEPPQEKKPVDKVVDKLTDKATSGSQKYTAYAGGVFSSSYVSLNARLGTYKPGFGSTSVDIGLTSSGLSLGLMSYYRKKIFVMGVGGTLGLGSSASLGIKLSYGISLMNKKQNASWDIFLDGKRTILPASSAITYMSLSFGRSIYFGKR